MDTLPLQLVITTNKSQISETIHNYCTAHRHIITDVKNELQISYQRKIDRPHSLVRAIYIQGICRTASTLRAPDRRCSVRPGCRSLPASTNAAGTNSCTVHPVPASQVRQGSSRRGDCRRGRCCCLQAEKIPINCRQSWFQKKTTKFLSFFYKNLPMLNLHSKSCSYHSWHLNFSPKWYHNVIIGYNWV